MKDYSAREAQLALLPGLLLFRPSDGDMKKVKASARQERWGNFEFLFQVLQNICVSFLLSGLIVIEVYIGLQLV